MILVNGRFAPVITVVGSKGTGKSILAWRTAQLITRAADAPNVLLVDADVYGGGLTAQIELFAKSPCGYLHDVIVGKNPNVQPIDLEHISLESNPHRILVPNEGRLFLLPGSSDEASSPYFAVMNSSANELQKVLCQAITHAAGMAKANFIVIDTASMPEPCAAVFVSITCTGSA